MGLKFLIDCSNLQAGGGIQVATSFVYDLLQIKNESRYCVVLAYQMKNAFKREQFDDRFTFIDLSTEQQASILKRGKFVKAIEDNYSPSKVFCVFGPSYYKSSVPKIVGFALPHFIYEDSPFFATIGWKQKLRLFLMKKAKISMFLRNSDKLIFETEDAKKIFSEKYDWHENNSYTVSNTLNNVFLDKSRWREIDLQKENKKTVLCLSVNYPHKNLKIIPEVIDFLVDVYGHKEIMFYVSSTKESLRFDDKYDPYITYLGKVELEKVPSLYQKTDVLFMPTLLEVFSTTYLEGMHMEVPIVASNLSFARDICSSAALYFEPLSPQAAAEKIDLVLRDSKVRNGLIHEGKENLKRFGGSMDRTVKYLEILKESL